MLTVYSKPNCPHCEQAKSWLDSNKIEYDVVEKFKTIVLSLILNDVFNNMG